MKVRFIKNKEITGTSHKFNFNSQEVIICLNDEGLDSEYIKDLEVEIKDEWISLSEAFKQKLLITDNHNIGFFEPINNEEKERGYRL